jgi:hypothetical protein
MQDGVRCVISEREARHDGVGVRPGTVYVGRWCVGVVCRSGRGRHGRQHTGMEGCLYGRVQGAGDGDQLMEGKEELWGPGKGGPSNRRQELLARSYYTCIVHLLAGFVVRKPSKLLPHWVASLGG